MVIDPPVISFRKIFQRHSLEFIIFLPALTITFLALSAGYGWYRFGSVNTSLTYLRGVQLLIEKNHQVIAGDSETGQILVQYKITNLTYKPLRILGAPASCSCTVVEDLPLILVPLECKTLQVKINISRENEDFSGSITLLTDAPNTPEIPLTYTVRLAKPS